MDNQSNNRIAKNSIFLSLRMAVVMVISIFTIRYLLKNLGVEDYGIYNVTLGIVSMCSFIIPTLTNANQRYHSYELGRNGRIGAQKVFITGLHIQLMTILVVVFICETVGLWYIKERLVVPEGRKDAVFWIYQISVVAVSSSMIQIPYIASILAHEHMNFYAIINVLDASLKLLIAICIASSPSDKLVVYGCLLLSINFLNLLLYVGYSHYHFTEVRFSKKVHRSLLKEMLKFSGWNLFETIARIGKDQGGNLILNFYFGPILNAARGVANQVSYAFASLVESTVMASRPKLVTSYAKGEIKTSISMFNTLSKGVLLIIYIFSFPVFLEADYILKLWLGASVPDYAVEFVRLSILIILIDKLATPVTALLHATGKIKKYHVISGIINILVIPVSYILVVAGLGPLSIYFSTLGAAFIAQLFFVSEVSRLLPYSIHNYIIHVITPFFKVYMVAFLPTMFCYYLIDSGLYRVIVVSLVSILFGLFSIVRWGLDEAERIILLSLIKKRTS